MLRNIDRHIAIAALLQTILAQAKPKFKPQLVETMFPQEKFSYRLMNELYSSRSKSRCFCKSFGATEYESLHILGSDFLGCC